MEFDLIKAIAYHGRNPENFSRELCRIRKVAMRFLFLKLVQLAVEHSAR